MAVANINMAKRRMRTVVGQNGEGYFTDSVSEEILGRCRLYLLPTNFRRLKAKATDRGVQAARHL